MDVRRIEDAQIGGGVLVAQHPDDQTDRLRVADEVAQVARGGRRMPAVDDHVVPVDGDPFQPTGQVSLTLDAGADPVRGEGSCPLALREMRLSMQAHRQLAQRRAFFARFAFQHRHDFRVCGTLIACPPG